MNEEMRRKCFTLFGNLRFKKDINQGGLGLGLASASLICKALQGELNLIRSEENVGSKFHFTMSIKMGDPILNEKNKKIQQAKLDHHKNLKNYQPMIGLNSSKSQNSDHEENKGESNS